MLPRIEMFDPCRWLKERLVEWPAEPKGRVNSKLHMGEKQYLSTPTGSDYCGQRIRRKSAEISFKIFSLQNRIAGPPGISPNIGLVNLASRVSVKEVTTSTPTRRAPSLQVERQKERVLSEMRKSILPSGLPRVPGGATCILEGGYVQGWRF